MNASERPAVPRETNHVPEHRATPSVHTAPPEHRSNRQAPPQNPVGPHVLDAGASETFVGGDGI
jgi:hypothetical protein